MKLLFVPPLQSGRAFLVGIREGRKYKTVSKIGTGLSDEQWKELDKRAKKLEVREKPKEYEVDKNPEQSTTISELKKLYDMQKVR
ncbi:MAG: hypothetical protein E3K36_03710 [Candidatus Brocadia sp.]|nr:hypothetical protein [Candidatus Brocadia sp.]